MDSITNNNAYIDKLFENSKPLVIVKKAKGLNKTVLYVVVKSTKKETDSLLEEQKNNKSFDLPQHIYKLLEKENLINNLEELKECLFIGKLSDFDGYRNLVYQFPQTIRQKRDGIDPQFRFYCQSLEVQKIHAPHVNPCSTKEASWKSVEIAVNSNYGLVLRIDLIG